MIFKYDYLAEILTYSVHDPNHDYFLKHCLECGSKLLQNAYEVVCCSCGLIHARIIENPLNAYSDFPDSEKKVCHHSTDRPRGTYIGYFSSYASKMVSLEKIEQFKRLRELNRNRTRRIKHKNTLKRVNMPKEKRIKPYMLRAWILYEYKRKYYLINEELGYLVDLGKTQVGKILSLVKLPEELQTAIVYGEINLEPASILSQLAFDVRFPTMKRTISLESIRYGLINWDFSWEAEPKVWKKKRTRIQLELFEKFKSGNMFKKEQRQELRSIIQDHIDRELLRRKQENA